MEAGQLAKAIQLCYNRETIGLMKATGTQWRCGEWLKHVMGYLMIAHIF